MISFTPSRPVVRRPPVTFRLYCPVLGWYVRDPRRGDWYSDWRSDATEYRSLEAAEVAQADHDFTIGIVHD